jgi:hypothetical protein
MKRVGIVFLSICLLILGGYTIVSCVFLKLDKDIDVIKYEGRIYSNITELDWFKKEKNKYHKGERLGEIRRLSRSSLLLWDLSATKLPKGTNLYNADGSKAGIKPLIILAETTNGEFLYYRWLPKE